MRIFPFQALYPKMELVTSPSSFFGTIKHQYPQFVKSGFFKKSSKEGIYVYQIKSKKAKHVGIIATTDITEIVEDNILKHENTLAAKEQSMMQLLLERQAMIKPVLLGYNNVKEIDEFTDRVMSSAKPDLKIKFEVERQIHSLWQVSDGDRVEKIRQLFLKKVPQSYIADGHHRCSTTLKLYETNKVKSSGHGAGGILSVYFPFKELKIYDYNRIVELMTFMGPIEFMAALSKYLQIQKIDEPSRPQKKYEMTMFMHGSWYLLKWKKKILKKYKSEKIVLDASLFNEWILNKILGVKDVRTDIRIKYVEGTLGAQGVVEKALKNPENVGFCLYPVTDDEIKQIADDRKTLPPKSTWFEPRIKNGLIVQEF